MSDSISRPPDPVKDPIQDLARRLAAGDRRALARAITLVESTRPDHRAEAVALLAALVLGERMTKSRLGSVILGFIGVVVIVRPGLEGFQPTALVVLFAAFAFAVSLIVTKQLTNRVSTFAVIFWMNVIQLPITICWPLIVAAKGGPSFFVFRLGADLILPTIALGVVGLTSPFCLTQAFRSGDATVVVPLDVRDHRGPPDGLVEPKVSSTASLV